MSAQAFLLYNSLPEIARALHEVMSANVRKAAFDVEAWAKQKAVVDTGFMRNSLYTVTSNSSTYGQGASAGDAQHQLLPEVDKPRDDHTAYVAVGASYGLYVEFGTSRMAAQPYLIPAAEAVRPSFEEATRRIEESLRAAVLIKTVQKGL